MENLNTSLWQIYIYLRTGIAMRFVSVMLIYKHAHIHTREHAPHILEFLWWWVNYSMLFNNIKIKKTQFEKCAGNGNSRCVRRKQYILFLFFIYKSIRFAYIYVCVFVHMHSTVCIHETLHFKLVHIYFYYYKHNLYVVYLS